MKYYPYSPHDFTCQYCGAKAGSRCITRDNGRTWSIVHTARWRSYEYSLEQHGPLPQWQLTH